MRQSIKFSFLASHSYSLHIRIPGCCVQCACMHGCCHSVHIIVTSLGAGQAYSIWLLLLFFSFLLSDHFHTHVHTSLVSHHISWNWIHFALNWIELNWIRSCLMHWIETITQQIYWISIFGIFIAVRSSIDPHFPWSDAYRFHFGNNDRLILIKKYSNNL